MAFVNTCDNINCFIEFIN